MKRQQIYGNKEELHKLELLTKKHEEFLTENGIVNLHRAISTLWVTHFDAIFFASDG